MTDKIHENWRDNAGLLATALVDIKSLQAENEALRVDAERYRWLRLNLDDSLVMHGDVSEAMLMGEEELDAAIDAAITQQGEPHAD